MIIPHDQLSDEALSGVIEEFVTRDGTDQTEASAKSARVLAGLVAGELVVVFDPESASCNILDATQLPDESDDSEVSVSTRPT